MTNKSWTILLGVIATGLLAWFYSLNQEDNQLGDLVKTQQSPDYVGNQMATDIFSPTGKKQYIAVAKKVEYFESDGHTDFDRPEVKMFETENTENLGQQSWQLTANQATLTKDNMLYLKGNVVLQSKLANSKLQRVESEQVNVNLKTQDIQSDTMVKINGQNFYSQGLKLNGNLKQQTANLKEQVKTFYQISNSNNPPSSQSSNKQNSPDETGEKAVTDTPTSERESELNNTGSQIK